MDGSCGPSLDPPNAYLYECGRFQSDQEMGCVDGPDLDSFVPQSYVR